MLDEAAEQLEKVEVRMPDLPVIHAYPGRGVRAARPGRARRSRSIAARSAPSRASSGPIDARRAAPSMRAGPIGVLHAVAGTASGPSAAATAPSPAWRQWLTAAVDLVFPPFCPVCAERLGRRPPRSPVRRLLGAARADHGARAAAGAGCRSAVFAADEVRARRMPGGAHLRRVPRGAASPSRMRGRPPTTAIMRARRAARLQVRRAAGAGRPARRSPRRARHRRCPSRRWT